MKYNFCTLFDSYYLTRGIALYKSLEQFCDDFHLYIFVFDEKSYSLLKKLSLAKATVISHKDFEDDELKRVKKERTIAEYYWTCTASTIWYSIKNFNLDHCTYLDADILFFSSLDPIYEEIGNHSIAITPHNFTPELKSSEVLGKYCVQFVYFKNDVYGLEALNWWRESCIDWCYAKIEDGKYGDQKYLDYFHVKFKNVVTINNIGVGVAPWNIGNYNIEYNSEQVYIILKNAVHEKYSLIFYHYQGLKFKEYNNKIIAEASPIKIPPIGLKKIYIPYIKKLMEIKNKLQDEKGCSDIIIFRRNLLKSFLTKINGYFKNYNIIRKIYFFVKVYRYNRPKGIGSGI